MKEERNHEAPMKFQGPNPETVQCKDCAFRDRTVLELNGKTIPVGVVKSWCKVYNKDISPRGKPVGILFETEKCKHYRKDAE